MICGENCNKVDTGIFTTSTRKNGVLNKSSICGQKPPLLIEVLKVLSYKRLIDPTSSLNVKRRDFEIVDFVSV